MLYYPKASFLGFTVGNELLSKDLRKSYGNQELEENVCTGKYESFVTRIFTKCLRTFFVDLGR